MPFEHYIKSITNLISLLAHNLPLFLAGVLGLGFLIGFHELGHFLFCKLFGISTPSFSIGFGPRLLSKKIGDTEFALSAIPLGGYVEIAGAQEIGQGDQKEAFRKDKHSFASKPYYQKMLVIAGGILFNLIFAYATFIGLFMTGLPKTNLLFPLNSTTQVKQIVATGPSSQADIRAGDIITKIDGQTLSNGMVTLLDYIKPRAQQEVNLTLQREGQEVETPVTLDSRTVGGQAIGTLGIEFEYQEIQPKSLSESTKQGISTTNAFIINTFKVFLTMFKCRSMDGLGGPIMVISQTIQGASQGVKIFLILLAIISINLAVINVIPLPVMDGGQALFYTIEALTGRPLSEQVRYMIHYVTWILVVALFIYLMFKDTFNICKAWFN